MNHDLFKYQFIFLSRSYFQNYLIKRRGSSFLLIIHKISDYKFFFSRIFCFRVGCESCSDYGSVLGQRPKLAAAPPDHVVTRRSRVNQNSTRSALTTIYAAQHQSSGTLLVYLYSVYYF